MCEIPLHALVKVSVEKPGFFGRSGQECVLIENVMQPTAAGARGADYKEGWESAGLFFFGNWPD
jgi:hypothetical protein